jgi:hypothetical protein
MALAVRRRARGPRRRNRGRRPQRRLSPREREGHGFPSSPGRIRTLAASFSQSSPTAQFVNAVRGE